MEIILYILSFAVILIAQAVFSSTYRKYKRVKNAKGYTGFDIARTILDNKGYNDIMVLETTGIATDHYDPVHKVIRLSKEVYSGNSIASASIAAHECGHVVQHKTKYVMMNVRSVIVPFANFATRFGYIVIVIGFISSIFNIVMFGIILLCVILVFQLVTLPVEFDASRRANEMLNEYQLIENKDSKKIKRMLNAAALTYVASLFSSMLQILRLLLSANRR